MTYQLDWTVLWSGQTGAWLIHGILVTLQLSAVGWLAAVTLGILSGALRTVTIAPLRWGASAYVEFFRNVPLLVWMFFWYFGMPPLLPAPMQDWLLDHRIDQLIVRECRVIQSKIVIGRARPPQQLSR